MHKLYKHHSLILAKRDLAEAELVNELKSKRRQTQKANVKSDKLIAEKRRQKLREIFSCIDQRADEIKTARLPEPLKQVLTPLLRDLQQLQRPVRCAEFVDAGARLYEVSTIEI